MRYSLLTRNLECMLFALLSIVLFGCDSGGYDQQTTAPSQSIIPTATTASTGDTPKIWQADQSILDKLEPSENIDSYRIRVPKGYMPVNMPSAPQPGLTTRFWRLLRRSDNSSAVLMVVLKKGEYTDSGANLLDRAFNAEILGVQKRLTDFQQGPIESGSISGLIFKKADFQGTPKGETKKAHGFCYVCLDGDTTIVIAGQDQEPHHQESLNVINAAILSFCKK